MARISKAAVASIVAVGLVSCGDAPNRDPFDATADATAAPPAEPAAIYDWLQSGDYRDWDHAPGISAGLNQTGHRVYLNDLADRPGSQIGAAGVRELYDGTSQAARQIGWSVVIKTHDDRLEPAQNWYFYETFDLDDADAFAIAGHAANGCVACHSSTPDIIQSQRPL
jgi:hypothetical protein